MRIVSNFKDYYDGLQDFDSFTWNRENRHVLESSKEFKEAYNRLDLLSWIQEKNNLIKIPIILGYCGEFYKYYIACSNTPSYEEFITPTKANPFHILEVDEKDENIKWYSKHRFSQLDVSFLKDLDLFHRYKSPVFIIHSVFKEGISNKDKTFQVIINPSFRSYGMTKLKSINQLYQDLEMYITGVLTSSEVYPEPEDKFRMGARFDKYSFRKLPEKPL